MYNALESLQAFEAGTAGRKAREKETAMTGIGNALAGGDIAGATAQAFKVDPMYGMQLQQYGDQRNALALRKDIGGMIGAGDRKGAAAKAYTAGEFEMGASIDAQIAQMTQKQREDALFLSSELGNAALTLQGITDPQQRAAQWQQMQGRFVNDFGMDPAALAQFNPMDDMALQRAIGEAQSFSDRLAGKRADEQFAYTKEVDTRNFNRGVYEFDTTRQDALDAAAAEAETTPAAEFGDVWKMREAFEKRAQGFEESQRQYYMMQDLAADGTGASDVALGFAFFKTIDPTSTVREGEFAQAASSMGLGASMVQMFSRLDKGEKFSPQLRKDLLQAAGRAYDQQARDIQGLYERESQFVGSYGVDPSYVTRNPVRGQAQGDGKLFKGGVLDRLPPDAVADLLSDPSPEAQREFDEVFGPGQAQRLLSERGYASQRMKF